MRPSVWWKLCSSDKSTWACRCRASAGQPPGTCRSWVRDLWTWISMRRRSQRPQPQQVNTVHMNTLTCPPFLLISFGWTIFVADFLCQAWMRGQNSLLMTRLQSNLMFCNKMKCLTAARVPLVPWLLGTWCKKLGSRLIFHTGWLLHSIF